MKLQAYVTKTLNGNEPAHLSIPTGVGSFNSLCGGYIVAGQHGTTLVCFDLKDMGDLAALQTEAAAGNLVLCSDCLKAFHCLTAAVGVVESHRES
jgi:hypothetical protein